MNLGRIRQILFWLVLAAAMSLAALEVRLAHGSAACARAADGQ